MLVRLVLAVNRPFHRRDVHDVLVERAMPEHQRLQPGREHERRDCVHKVHLQKLHRGDLGERQPPRVVRPKVDLLKVLVERALGKQVDAARERAVLRRERGLRQERAGGAWRSSSNAASSGRTVSGVCERRPFGVDEVRVEPGRASHRLAGVVDNEVEPVEPLVERAREAFDGGRQAQVEAVDLAGGAPRRRSRARGRSARRRRRGSAS